MRKLAVTKYSALISNKTSRLNGTRNAQQTPSYKKTARVCVVFVSAIFYIWIAFRLGIEYINK